MMRLAGTQIILTRGDSAYLKLEINDNDGNKYELQDGDEIKVQVRTAPLDEGELVFNGLVEYENDEIIWHIRPEDTEGLPVDQILYYDCQLKMANGDIFTFIPMSKFRLKDEVSSNH